MAVYYSPKMEELTRINDEQREHMQDLKRQLDEEKNKLKHVQEEKVREIKNVREEERTKAIAEKGEFEQKLQRQMHLELMSKIDGAQKDFENQVAGLKKTHKQELESQLQNFQQEKRELEGRINDVEEKAKEQVKSQLKSESDKFIREVFKLQEQLSKSNEMSENLKQENKRLKDDLLKQKAEYDQELSKTDKNLRVTHQKQVEEIKEKTQQLAEKDKHISKLKRKCDILEAEKEKLEDNLQLAKKGLPYSKEDSRDEAHLPSPAKSSREDDLLMTNSELGLLVKRLRKESQQLKKDKSIVEGRCKAAEEVVEPLKKRREQDMIAIQELNHLVDSKEKQVQKIAKEKNEITLERDRLKKDLEAEKNALAKQRMSDKREAEIGKLKKLLAAKSKELETVQENNAKLNMDLQKLKDDTNKSRKEKAEARMTQLTTISPRSPVVEKKVKEHRRLVELEQNLKEKTDKLDESVRSKARLNQQVVDLNESMRRRIKQIKALSDENHKLKSSNQSLEEACKRTHQETMEEWTQTRSELDRAHAQINKLQQENTSLLDELSQVQSTGIISSLHLTPNRRPSRSRSKSPSPVHHRIPASSLGQNRARSLSPRHHVASHRHAPKQTHTLPISPSYPPKTSSPIPSTNGLDNANVPHHTLPTSPSHYSRTPSPLSNYLYPPASSPIQITVNVPTAEEDPVSPDDSFNLPEDDFGSQWSLESLKDKIELYEFEKEETKIWREEHLAEFGLLKGKYNVLKERYNSLLKRTRTLSKKFELAQKERLEVDREVARLQEERGGEFDVRRETSLREKLAQANLRVKQLEEELDEQHVNPQTQEREEKEQQLLLANSQMKIQLTELSLQLEELENQLKEKELLLTENEEIIKTKEKQMVGLERMLAEKEGELEGERAMVSSLKQQQLLQVGVASGGVASPERHSTLPQEPHLARCLQSALSVTDELKNTATSELKDDQFKRLQGLIDYLQQVIQEAKAYTEQNVKPSATATEGFEEVDTGDRDSVVHSISTAADTRKEAWLQQKLAKLEDENRALKSKIKEFESHLINSASPIPDYGVEENDGPPTKDLPKSTSEELEDLTKQQKIQFEAEKSSLISKIEKLETQLAQKEVELQKVGSELKKHLSTDTIGGSTGKDDWFQQWMARFELEKKSMKTKIRELEKRLVNGSQRVNDLQELVGELEGRLKETENLSIPPSAIQDRDEYITSLTEQLSDLREKLNEMAPPSYPTSLGLQVNQTFQQTQHAIGRGDIDQSRLELRNLERAISQLLNAVFPQGLVVPASMYQKDSNVEDSLQIMATSPVSSPLTSVSPPPPPYVLPTCHSPVPISPEAELTTDYTNPNRVFSEDKPNTSLVPKKTKEKARKNIARNDIRLFVALLDYNPLSLCSTGHPEKELTLHTGDVIAVTGEMDSDGYYNGIFEGRRGLVPAKFLEEMDVKNKEVQQRLLNQSLSHSLSPSLHGSDIDVASSPSPVHKTTPTSVKVTPSLTTSTPQGARPSPPHQFVATRSVGEDSLLVMWKPPALDDNGRSNGFLVTGYTVTCDGVKVKATEFNGPKDRQVLLVEVDPQESHMLSICTRSSEGISSIVIMEQYTPRFAEPVELIKRNDTIRVSQRSYESMDSDIQDSKLMIALYDYSPPMDSPDHHGLSFAKGQLITVYGSMRDDGFFHGELGGQFGLVPSTFIAEFDPKGLEVNHQPLVSSAITMTTNQSPQQSGRSRRKLFKTQGK